MCPYCGAPNVDGYVGCLNNNHVITHFLNAADPVNDFIHFLSVDATCLQHPEEHSTWNNYYHLARLELIFENKIIWSYRFSSILSSKLNIWKQDKEPTMLAPATGHRGELTSYGLKTVTTPEECEIYVTRWAKSVYDSYGDRKNVLKPLTEMFFQVIN